jgi:hypothetical protein
MKVAIELTGVSPLVFHNARLADKADEIVREIASLTDKKTNRTDADDEQIGRLEWFGGLYYDAETGVYVPTWNVVRSLENGAKLTRKGATVIRAIAVSTDKAPLDYSGPREPKALEKLPEFRWRTQVGIQRGKVTRVRPIFRQWMLRVEAELADDLLDLRELQSIADAAGRSEGLGDARKLGYGRYTATVSAAG